MTTQDYEKIARILREEIPGGETRIIACEKFADMLAADNARFDRNKFYTACGGIVTELISE
jgi:hypothetical protein